MQMVQSWNFSLSFSVIRHPFRYTHLHVSPLSDRWHDYLCCNTLDQPIGLLLGGEPMNQRIGLVTPFAHQLLFTFDLLIYLHLFVFCFVFKCSE